MSRSGGSGAGRPGCEGVRMQAFTQAIKLLHNLTKEALAAQGGILTQQGQQLMQQDKKD